MKSALFLVVILGWQLAGSAAESWTTALEQMPLQSTDQVLNHTNCAEVVLGSFQSNAVAKALVFMPGATDELYFFRRAQATLTNLNPSLLDALVALTNQSHLQFEFRAPFVLVHSPEDVLEVDFTIKHERTLQKLQNGKPLPHLLALDRDWNQLLRMIRKRIPPTLLPFEGNKGSWHFYRHTFAGWNLTPWEVMEATARAGKTKFTVIRNGVVFEVDSRVGEVPKLETFPGH